MRLLTIALIGTILISNCSQLSASKKAESMLLEIVKNRPMLDGSKVINCPKNLPQVMKNNSSKACLQLPEDQDINDKRVNNPNFLGYGEEFHLGIISLGFIDEFHSQHDIPVGKNNNIRSITKSKSCIYKPALNSTLFDVICWRTDRINPEMANVPRLSIVNFETSLKPIELLK